MILPKEVMDCVWAVKARPKLYDVFRNLEPRQDSHPVSLD